MAQYSYIITHRESDKTRRNNLNFVLKWVSSIKNDIEIILVEQDIKQRVDQSTLPTNCKYIFAYNKNLFNRAWGLNIGFQQSVGKALAFADNDVIIDREVIEDCFTACSEKYNYDAIKPFNKLVDLSKEETNKLLKNADLESIVFKGDEIRLGISFCSAFAVFKREAYYEIAGFDERFVGWGCEDDAISKFKIPLLKKVYVADEKAYHLWHERSKNDTNSQPNYENNLRLLKEYQNYTEKEIIALCEKTRSTFGMLNNKH